MANCLLDIAIPDMVIFEKHGCYENNVVVKIIHLYRILLPLMQSYARAGEFTFYEKLKSALKDNILYYGSYVCLCVVCLFYIVIYTNISLDGFVFLLVISVQILRGWNNMKFLTDRN